MKIIILAFLIFYVVFNLIPVKTHFTSESKLVKSEDNVDIYESSVENILLEIWEEKIKVLTKCVVFYILVSFLIYISNVKLKTENVNEYQNIRFEVFLMFNLTLSPFIILLFIANEIQIYGVVIILLNICMFWFSFFTSALCITLLKKYG